MKLMKQALCGTLEDEGSLRDIYDTFTVWYPLAACVCGSRI